MRALCELALCLAVILILSGNCFGYGSPGYFPDGSHPRLWLTSTRLAEMRAARDASSAEWIALRDWCSSKYSTTSGYNLRYPDASHPSTYSLEWNGSATSFTGYRGWGWFEYIMNFSLAYQVLKDSDPVTANNYGILAKNIVNGMLDTLSAGEERDNIILLLSAGDGTRFFTNNQALATAMAGRVDAIPYRPGKYGYTARNGGMALAVAYDFLNDLLSDSEKTRWQTAMFGAFDWMRGKRSIYNKGILFNGVRYYEDSDIASYPAGGGCSGTYTDGTTNNCTTVDVSYQVADHWNITKGESNFYSGYFVEMLLTGIVTYGENADAAGYYNYAKGTMYDGFLKANWNDPKYLKGGDPYEGWNYGGGFYRDFEAIAGLATATGSNPISDTDFPEEVVQSYIHSTASNLTTMVETGVWGTDYGKLYQYHIYPAMYLLQELKPTSPYIGSAKYLLDNGSFLANSWLTSTNGYWEKFLFYRPTTTAVSFVSGAGAFPLTYENTGNGLVAMRSSWANASDTISSWFQMGKGQYADHQKYDVGHFAILRGSDWLLESNQSVNYNSNSVIDFDGKGQKAYGNDYAVPQTILGSESGSNYYYVKADLKGGYQRVYYPGKYADLYTRNVVYIRPNYWVIMDYTKSCTIGTAYCGVTSYVKDWYSQWHGTPIVGANNTVSYTNGGSKAFLQTLFPTSVTQTVDSSTDGYGQTNGRVKTRPTSTNQNDQFLHIIEVTDSTSSQTTTTLIDSTLMRGAQIDTNIVMFGKDQNGAYPIGTINYNYNGVSVSKHYLALAPGQGYDVSVSGSSNKTVSLVPNDSSSIKVSANGLLVFTINDSANSIMQDNNGELDTTQPTITSFILPTTSSSLTVPVTTFTGTDNLGITGYCITETNSSNGCNWLSTPPTSYTFSTDGGGTAYAWLKDAAGNISAPVTQNVVVSVLVSGSSAVSDTSAPVITDFAMPTTSTSLTVPITTLTATDNVGVTGYMVVEGSTPPFDNATGWSATAPTSITFSGPGTKTAYAWAKDAAGNLSNGLGKSVTITIPDTTAPTVSTFLMPSTSATLTVAISNLTATDNVGVTGYLVTESAIAPDKTATGWSSKAPTVFTFSSTGFKIAYAWAKDAAGNVSLGMARVIIVTPSDITPPTINISEPVSNTTVSGIVSIHATANDNIGVAKVEFYVNGALKSSSTLAPYSFAWDTNLLTNGTYTLAAKAYDAAGNIGQSSTVSATVFNDRTAPIISAFTVPTSATTLSVPISSFSATDNVAVTGYLITENAIAPFASTVGWSVSAPSSYTFATMGTKTLYAWAKDYADNVSAAKTATIVISIPKTVSQDVMVLDSSTTFPTIQDAYNTVPESGTIAAKDVTLSEQLNFNRAVNVNLAGGMDASFQSTTGTTAVSGVIKISKGKVVVSKIIVR